MIAYTLVGNSLFCTILEGTFAKWFGYADGDGFHRIFSAGAYLVFALLTLPLQLMKDTSKFGAVGYLAIITLFYILIVTVMQTNTYTAHRKEDHITMFKFDNPLLMLQDIGCFTFALYFMDCVFLIRNDMGKAGTEKNIIKMGGMSILTMLIPFFAIGTLGYISLGDAAMNVDIFPARPALEGSNDIAMTIGQVLVVLSVILANMSRVIAMKCHVFDMMGKEINSKNNILWTVCTMFIPSICAFVYPAVNDWVSLLGAFCMATLLIGLPGIVGMAIFKEKGKTLQYVLILCWVVFWLVISYTSAVLTALKMVGVINLEN